MARQPNRQYPMASQPQAELQPFNLQETKSAIGKFQILIYISIVKLMYFSCSSPLKKQVGFFIQLSYFGGSCYWKTKIKK